MPKYDNNIIEEIKIRNDIEGVISQYVTLTRAGSNLKGLCPFHSEKTASFTVFPDTRSFYCFGCGAGGDVITFVKRIENIEYPAALEQLAKRAGISLPSEKDERYASKRSRFYDMNRDAAKFFHSCLKESPEALEYLKKRGLNGATVKHFGLGYAPDGFELVNYMKKKGYTDDELCEGFLCGRSKKTGGLYPYFRRRLMFPIIDVSGSVLAFGGRIIGEGEPKYLNSSDTPVFKKSRTLYALNFAKNNCSDRLILCEGYMDVIALHAAGFENAVAALGTAFTSEHARIMKKYTKSAVLAFDSDGAGQRAVDRAFRLLEEVGLDVRVLKMKGAKDPDEYIKTYGGDRFKALLDGSVTRFDFELARITAANDITLTDGKIKAASDVAQFISTVHSAVEREIYIASAAKKLEISVESLRADVDRRIRKAMRESKESERQKIYINASAISDRVNPDAAKNLRSARAEEAIIGLLLNRREYLAKIKRGEVELKTDNFYTALGQKLFALIMENSADDGEIFEGAFGEALSDEEMGRLTRLRIMRDGLKNDETVFYDCIQTLKESKEEKSLEDIINEKRKRDGN